MTLGERLALAAVEARLTGAAIRPPIVGDRYEVLAVLGAGGMGEVFRARDRELDREVALKLVRPSIGSIAGLVAEARTLAQLAHPNIVTVFDVVSERDDVAIVMELVRGRSLRRWLDERTHQWTDVLRVLVAAGRGLAAAHDAGIVHRDVKPDNIMIGDDGSVRLVDFGLAHASHDAMITEPATSPVVHGTIGYLAPELRDGRAADARSDQLAFCLTCYEALHGRHALVDPPSFARPWPQQWTIAESRRHVTRRIHRAIERGLAEAPGQRHPSMHALLAALAPRPRTHAAWMTMAAASVAIASAIVLAPRTRPSAHDDAAVEASSSERTGLDRIDQLAADGATADALALARSERDRLRIAGDREGAIAAAQRIGELADLSGDYAAAELALGEAYFEARALGDEARAIDAALALSAMLAHELARPDEAATWLRHARALLREESPVHTRARVEVAEAGLLLEQGRPADAIARYRAALDPSLGDRDGEAWKHHDLGVAYHDAGNDEQAVIEYERALALLGVDEGVEDPGVAAVLANLGNALSALGRSDQALTAHRRALAIRLRTLGEDHRETAASRINVGGILAARGLHDEARDHYLCALAVQEHALGPDHPDLAATLNNLGIIAADSHDALTWYRRAQEIQERTLAPDDPQLAFVLGNVAIAEAALGRRDRARALLERALAIRERAYGPEHPQTAYPLHNLGVIELDDGRFDRSITLLERALRIRSDGRDPLLLATTQLSLAQALSASGGDRRRARALARAARTAFAAGGLDDRVAEADALL
jgi:tetratricopeptide (TPR) repeat protein/predicted Ser/Thr protein kinase